MGLFSALRDRLFGSPEAEPEPEGLPSEHVEATTDPGETVSEHVDVPAEPAEEAPSDVDLGEAATDEPVVSEEIPEPVGDPPSETAASHDEAVAARQERVASRILEDERLRGDLTDDEFQPLLDWALAAADELVASTAGQTDEQADRRIDGGLSAIRDAVAAAGDAIAAYAERDADRLQRALADAGLGAGDRGADGAIARLMIERDLPGPEIAALLAHRLGAVTMNEPPPEKPS